MGMTIRSKIINIGNSRGILIPRPLLEQIGLTDEVEMSVEGDKLIVQPVHQIRQGWEAQFATMAKLGDDLLLEDVATSQ
jgi:antitoxin MazE